MKKKGIILCLMMILLTGCTIVRIDTKNINSMVDVVLSKDNTLYNRVGIGYKYYVPKGVTYIDSSGPNDKLYSNGVYYYLYLDEIAYYYKSSLKFKEDPSKYYSRKISNGGKTGYLEITKKDELYLIEFVYNYAKIEALVPEEDINSTVLNSSYILSTIKYNYSIVKLSIEDDSLKTREKKYEEFTSKKQTNSFLRYEEEKD